MPKIVEACTQLGELQTMTYFVPHPTAVGSPAAVSPGNGMDTALYYTRDRGQMGLRLL